MKTYPLGVQTFSEIREKNLLYIDKTKEIYRLLQGKYYFYARPRRFGKSLMLSTIKAIYEGKKELFKGLWIENKWDFSKVHPVIHIGFSGLNYQDKSLEAAISTELSLIADRYKIVLKSKFSKDKFKELISTLASEKGKVILLVDEYDKPIIDYLGDKIEEAEKNRSTLKTFYSVIKDSDPYIEFLMITGVSKFSKVSIFSELNNLTDITFHRRYQTLTGITQQELETNFAEEIEELAEENEITNEELLAEIKKWYNGYSWNAKTFLYNPYSILSYFDFGEFRNFWFETGTPTFLLKLMDKQKMVKIENLEAGNMALSSNNSEYFQLTPLLFETGYLSIKRKKENDLYILDYPNLEVSNAMQKNIMAIAEKKY